MNHRFRNERSRLGESDWRDRDREGRSSAWQRGQGPSWQSRDADQRHYHAESPDQRYFSDEGDSYDNESLRGQRGSYGDQDQRRYNQIGHNGRYAQSNHSYPGGRSGGAGGYDNYRGTESAPIGFGRSYEGGQRLGAEGRGRTSGAESDLNRGNPSRGGGGFAGPGPKGYSRTDDRIREDVCERLSQDDEVDASEIEVKVSAGEVTLEGSVNTRSMKHQAEDIAESVSGVRDVSNNLKVVKGVLSELKDKLNGEQQEKHFANSGTRNDPSPHSHGA